MAGALILGALRTHCQRRPPEGQVRNLLVGMLSFNLGFWPLEQDLLLFINTKTGFSEGSRDYLK